MKQKELAWSVAHFHSPVIIGDEVDGHTQVTITTWSADPVKVGFGVLGEIEVDDHVDSLDVNTSCEQICQHNTHLSEHNVKNKVYTDVYLMHPIMGNSRRLLSISSSKMPHIFLAVPEELDAMLYITTGLSLCVST